MLASNLTIANSACGKRRRKKTTEGSGNEKRSRDERAMMATMMMIRLLLLLLLLSMTPRPVTGVGTFWVLALTSALKLLGS